jgi:hypothetical protein
MSLENYLSSKISDKSSTENRLKELTNLRDSIRKKLSKFKENANNSIIYDNNTNANKFNNLSNRNNFQNNYEPSNNYPNFNNQSYIQKND